MRKHNFRLWSGKNYNPFSRANSAFWCFLVFKEKNQANLLTALDCWVTQSKLLSQAFSPSGFLGLSFLLLRLVPIQTSFSPWPFFFSRKEHILIISDVAFAIGSSRADTERLPESLSSTFQTLKTVISSHISCLFDLFTPREPRPGPSTHLY